MSKRKAGGDIKRKFNEQWENEFLFIASPSGKPFCTVCKTTLSQNRKHDLKRHYTTQHRAEIDGKKLLLGSELRKEYVAKKKEEIRRQSLLRTKSCESLAMTAASYEIALTPAKRRKPFSDGEEIVKPCLNIFVKRIGDKNIESKVAKIALSKQTITRRIEELSHDVSNQLKDLVHSCIFSWYYWTSQWSQFETTGQEQTVSWLGEWY